MILYSSQTTQAHTHTMNVWGYGGVWEGEKEAVWILLAVVLLVEAGFYCSGNHFYIFRLSQNAIMSRKKCISRNVWCLNI